MGKRGRWGSGGACFFDNLKNPLNGSGLPESLAAEGGFSMAVKVGGHGRGGEVLPLFEGDDLF